MEEFHYFTIRYFSVILLGGIILIVLAGCSGSAERSNTFGSGERPFSTAQDPELRTWNQTPHGGSDEKSNSSPCGPTERYR